MRRATATLAAVFALASVEATLVVATAASAPALVVQAKPQTKPSPKPRAKKRTPPKKQRKATPPRKRTASRPPKAASPKAVPAVEAPAPLESAVGPSEPDVAKLARVRAKRTAVEHEIAKLRGQADTTLGELEEIDLDLRLAAHRLDEAQLEFDETRRRLNATLRDVARTRGRLEETRPRVLRSLSSLEKLGELSYARLLFSIDDPADVLRGYRYVARIASADGVLIRSYRDTLLQLSDLEEELKTRTAGNLENRRRLADAQKDLAARKAAREKRFMDISLQRALQERLAREYEKREADLVALLAQPATAVAAPGRPQAAIPAFDAAAPLRAVRGALPWPVNGTLVRRFGVEKDPKFGTRTIQQGIEIDAFPEVAVRAVHAGRVVYADQFVGYGMLVIIDHGQREHTLYGRLGELRVAAGEDVAEGALIGLLPNTRVTGTGLHFEVRVQGRPEDPLEWLSRP